MRIPAIALPLLLVGVLTAPPVAAQTPATQPPPAKPQPKPAGPQTRPGPGVGGFLLFDSQSMAAKDTFDAVFDKSTFQSVGFGAEAFNLFRGLFARVTYSKITENGSRVAVADGNALPLNIDLEMELGTTEVSGGWRFPLGKPRRTGTPARLTYPRFNAYGGGGFLFVSFRETSEFAGPEDNSRESFNGYTVFGGVDATIWKLMYGGAEVQYRTVPDALGEGGASKEFGETDLGGFVFRVLFGIRK
jgi:opacity protein-like surface antigen